ncbi:hypothetical protein P691DRAFT_657386 [Macrolepiota fuliginosa MF-IS2]|uniref:Tetraspanin n=1 Tax=Macrolepiota fuliginosa MF-IS2 TaxID=1400762 RepID=A0A9P6CAB3_9AGAR|nr:hypothetical protein P691DRAFT_657386 [Macrolepiota fuliginosa MF-IS2]
MSPKFCCCLPLRLGVLVISFIQFLLCGAAAGGFWYLLWLLNNRDAGEYISRYLFGIVTDISSVENVQNNVRIALIVAGSIYSFAAIVGLFGFMGGIFKKNGLVRTYLSLLYITLMLQAASGIYSLVMFYKFRRNDSAREDCIKGSTDPNRINFCNALDRFGDTPTWAVWVSSIVPIVIVAYACYVVHSYSRRLVQQKLGRDIIATTGAVYAPVKSEEAHPLTQPTYTYPYSDVPNSFGGNPAPPPTTGHAASYYYDNQHKV